MLALLLLGAITTIHESPGPAPFEPWDYTWELSVPPLTQWRH